jgi:uncharacterized protein YihD (DUF1040 family)|tara:strand:- start:2644 stop:3273 length:630 start_codon:yes stop_codon:yes gene_type:complete
MFRFKFLFLVTFLIILTSCSKSKNIEIIFEDNFMYKAQKELIFELKLVNTKKDIKNILLNQDWIEDFKINFRINGNVRIIINTKIPIFIWNEKYYIDNNMETFNFDKTNNQLIKVFCPSNQLNDAMNLIDFINTKIKSEQNKFTKLDFKYSSGWILVSKNNTEIKFGKVISKDRLNSFKQSLNYVYESNSIPSMIDLRYKDGVALNYGK